MNKLLNILRNDRIVGMLGMMLLLVICLPYIILGKDAYITIHDNLDGVISNLKLLKDNHALFDQDAILPMMGGIRRSSFGNEWNLTLLPFAFLPCYWANVVNILVVKITAYIGMFLMLRKHLTKELHPVIVMLVSLAFSCAPFYATCCGISAAGIPLLVYAFINLQDNRHLVLSYLLVIYYALGSYLPFSGMFLCAYLFAYGIYLYCKEHMLTKYYVYAFALLCGIYLLTNYHLLLSFFADSSYVSHRTEYSLVQLSSLRDTIDSWWNWMQNSQCHSGFFSAKFCIIIFLISLLIRRTKKMWIAGGVCLSVVILVFAMKCLPFIFPNIHLFQEFQFDRFYFLYPAVCFAMVAVSFENISVRFPSYYRIIGLCLVVVGLCLVAITVQKDDEVRRNWKHIIKPSYVQEPTYRQFFAEDIFDAIGEDIQISDRSSVKVASVAMYPAVAEYNGFYCIDGYMSDYPLSYKHAFRPIIAHELQKDEFLSMYYGTWGNRCYLLSSENGLTFLRRKDCDFSISNFDINVSVLSNLGCQYIFSAVPLPNLKGLSYINSYDFPSSYWRVYVYQIK